MKITMDRQNITYIVSVVLIIASFFGGYKYGQSQTVVDPTRGGINQRNSTGSAGNFGQPAGNNQKAGVQRFAGGLISGEIISQDSKSITVKMKDGNSRIIFYSNSTSVGKTTEGSVADLVVGKQVMVTGTSNADGSVSAQSIQIRPDQPLPTPIPESVKQ